MNLKARIARFTRTVHAMEVEQNGGQYTQVVSLGLEVWMEEDVALIRGLDHQQLEVGWLDMMSIALASMGQITEAIPYFERLVDVWGDMCDYRTQALVLINLGKAIDTAALECTHGRSVDIFEKVRTTGTHAGWFDIESNACEGLSSLALQAARPVEAMEFAQQAVVAADLMLEDDFASHHTRANALKTVLRCCDLTSANFDEHILEKYRLTAEQIWGEYDSMHLVDVYGTWVTRHFHMGRTVECEEAYAKVLQLAAFPKMQQNNSVARIVKNATETMRMVRAWLGLCV